MLNIPRNGPAFSSLAGSSPINFFTQEPKFLIALPIHLNALLTPEPFSKLPRPLMMPPKPLVKALTDKPAVATWIWLSCCACKAGLLILWPLLYNPAGPKSSAKMLRNGNKIFHKEPRLLTESPKSRASPPPA